MKQSKCIIIIDLILKKVKKAHLFRCITCKVKLEKDPNNSKYIPYEIGNEKFFWPFTSTSENENEEFKSIYYNKE